MTIACIEVSIIEVWWTRKVYVGSGEETHTQCLHLPILVSSAAAHTESLAWAKHTYPQNTPQGADHMAAKLRALPAASSTVPALLWAVSESPLHLGFPPPAGLLVQKASLPTPAFAAHSPWLPSAVKTLGFSPYVSCKPDSAHELRDILSIKGGRDSHASLVFDEQR